MVGAGFQPLEAAVLSLLANTAPVAIGALGTPITTLAQVTGLEPGDFVHTLGDAHLYLNHLEQARTQLSRTPRPLPRMVLNPSVTDLFAFRYEDCLLLDYKAHPGIKAPVAV